MLVNYLESQGNAYYRYRNTFPVLYLIVGVFVWQWSQPFIVQNRHAKAEIIYEAGCLALSLFGLAIRFLTRAFDQAEYKKGKNKQPFAEFLNTKGMYSIVRHPIYFADFFIYLGLVLYVQNLKFITCYFLLFTVFFERIIAAEESYLKQKFGKPFLDWAAKTPIFFPDISLLQTKGTTFSWTRALKKETPTLLKVMLLFYLLEWMNHFTTGHKVETLWHVIAIGTLLIAATAAIILSRKKK